MAKREVIWTNVSIIQLQEILEFFTKRNKSGLYSRKLYKKFKTSIPKVELDKQLTFVKNKNYWDNDSLGNKLPYLDGIKISFTQSSETEFLDFLSFQNCILVGDFPVSYALDLFTFYILHSAF